MSERLNFYSRYHRTKNQKDLDSLYHLIEGLDLDTVINDELVERVSYLKQMHLEEREKYRQKSRQEQQVHFIQGSYVLSGKSPKRIYKQNSDYNNMSNKNRNDMNIKDPHRKWSSLDKNGQKLFSSNFSRMQKIINHNNTCEQILQKMNTSRQSKRSNIKNKNGNQANGVAKNNRNNQILITSDQLDYQDMQNHKQVESPKFNKVNQKQDRQMLQKQGSKSSSSPINLLLLEKQLEKQMSKFEEELADNRNERKLSPNKQKQFKKDREKEKISIFDDQINLSEGLAELNNVDKLMNNSYQKKPEGVNFQFSENCKSEVLNREIFSNSDSSNNSLTNSRNKEDFYGLQPQTHNNFQQNKKKVNIITLEEEEQEQKGKKNGFSLFNKKSTQAPGIKIPYKGLSEGAWPTQKSIESVSENQSLPKSVASNESKNKEMNEQNPFQKQRKPFKKLMMDRKIQPRMATSTFVNEVMAVAQTVEAVKNVGVVTTNQTFKAIVTVKPVQYQKSVQTVRHQQFVEVKEQNQNKSVRIQSPKKTHDTINLAQSKQSAGSTEKKSDEHENKQIPNGNEIRAVVKKVNFKKIVKKEVASENNKQQTNMEGKKLKETKNSEQKKQKLLLASFFDQN